MEKLFSSRLKKLFFNVIKFNSQLLKIIFLSVFLFPVLIFSKNLEILPNKKNLETIEEKLVEEEIILNRYSKNEQIVNFLDEMVIEHHFDYSELKDLFDQVAYSATAVRLFSIKSPLTVKNWHLHRNRILHESLINDGLIFYNLNRDVIEKSVVDFAIPRSIVLAILGIETSFGRNMGNFSVLDVLTTLAFDYPDMPNQAMRKLFFKKNLKDFLILSRMLNVEPRSVLGSYAGAIGMAQFMPSNILKYALSADGKEKPSLLRNPADAVVSVANFLYKNGWRPGEPIAWKISQDTGNQELVKAGLKVCKPRQCSLKKFVEAGLNFDDINLNEKIYQQVIKKMLTSRITIIDLPTPLEPIEYMLAFTNFNVLLKYNHNYFYAASILELARELEKKISSQNS